MKKGKLIVFEGIDGCGKTTQIELLKHNLKKYTTEPVYEIANVSQGQLGKLIRRMLGSDKEELFISDRQVACVFLAELFIVVNDIKRLLEEGYNVVCSRYYYSTLAYAGKTEELYSDILAMAKFDIEPDILIYLNIDVDIALERITKERTHIEIFENKSLLDSIKLRYRKLLNDANVVKKQTMLVEVDATKSVQDIANIIFTEVEKQLT